MKNTIARRLDALERRRSWAARKIVVVVAKDQSEKTQISEMHLSGALMPSDGLLIVNCHTMVPAMSTMQ